MGSGKSTVAAALAERWSVAKRDTDEDIEAATGRKIADIFLDDGEDELRRLECDAVKTALHEHDGILAIGGGAVLRNETQAELADYRTGGGTVVFLDVTVEFATRRLGLDNYRPVFMPEDPRKRWVDIMGSREPVYKNVSTMRVLTDGLTPSVAANEIERQLERLLS